MTSPEAILDALDPEQQRVATCLHGPLAVVAGAGTGKTRAITHRIAYGALTGACDPRAVLAVTFTTRAAGELRARLQRLGVPGVQARTFHSAALRQAQYFWPKVYGTQLPAVIENRYGMVADAASRWKIDVDTAALRDLQGEISWAKVSNVTMESYPSLALAHHREISCADAATVGRVFATYEELKRDRGVIDFDDILLCTAALLAEHEDVAAQVRSTYRHLVVDEYQDVSPLQETVLDLWRGSGHDVCVVGDPAQTIHSFAGAQSGYLTSFAQKHPGATVVQLVRDYRSTPQIVGLANTMMRGQGAVSLEAQAPSGPEPVFSEFPAEPDEAAGVAAWLAERAAEGVEYREMAVLFRINAQSPTLEAALSERGIPYLVRGAERFYERREVRQALVTLRSQAAAAGGEPGIKAFCDVMAGLGWTEEAPVGQGAARERWESWSALVAVAEDVVLEAVEDQAPPPTLGDLVAALEERAAAQHAPVAQGVTLSTLHAAKGLEWDAVALVGMHEGTMPFILATTPAQVAEERRLLYVGITRARTHLHVSWSRGRSGTHGTRGPSRFLDGLTRMVRRTEAPLSRRTRGTMQSATCRVCGLRLHSAAERKIGRHLDCESSYDEATYERLRDWRREEAASQKMPAYVIFTDATLIAIAEACPSTPQELLTIPGVGQTKLARYGESVLAILRGEEISRDTE